jgi:hypothetical protein
VQQRHVAEVGLAGLQVRDGRAQDQGAGLVEDGLLVDRQPVRVEGLVSRGEHRVERRELVIQVGVEAVLLGPAELLAGLVQG